MNYMLAYIAGIATAIGVLRMFAGCHYDPGVFEMQPDDRLEGDE